MFPAPWSPTREDELKIKQKLPDRSLKYSRPKLPSAGARRLPTNIAVSKSTSSLHPELRDGYYRKKQGIGRSKEAKTTELASRTSRRPSVTTNMPRPSTTLGLPRVGRTPRDKSLFSARSSQNGEKKLVHSSRRQRIEHLDRNKKTLLSPESSLTSPYMGMGGADGGFSKFQTPRTIHSDVTNPTGMGSSHYYTGQGDVRPSSIKFLGVSDGDDDEDDLLSKTSLYSFLEEPEGVFEVGGKTIERAVLLQSPGINRGRVIREAMNAGMRRDEAIAVSKTPRSTSHISVRKRQETRVGSEQFSRLPGQTRDYYGLFSYKREKLDAHMVDVQETLAPPTPAGRNLKRNGSKKRSGTMSRIQRGRTLSSFSQKGKVQREKSSPKGKLQRDRTHSNMSSFFSPTSEPEQYSRRDSTTRAAAMELMFKNAVPAKREVNIWGVGGEDGKDESHLAPLYDLYKEWADNEKKALAEETRRQLMMAEEDSLSLQTEHTVQTKSTLSKLRAFTPMRETLPETLTEREECYDEEYKWPSDMVHSAESLQVKSPMITSANNTSRSRSLKNVEGEVLTEEDILKGFGTQARNEFFELYHIVSRRNECLTDPDKDLDEEALTPRQGYLQEITALGVLPYPALLRKFKNPKELNLAGKGLGDKIMLAVAKILPKVLEIQKLNVADNRLTDTSLVPLCNAVLEMPNLTALDLSSNKVDESADIIREYLKQKSCRLKVLTLSNADVDDDECRLMCESLKKNLSLSELNLCRNLIGDKENMNVVKPDFETGGEAIAEMLEYNTHITYLDLSWNSIRLESAVALAQVLRENNSLTTLILKHNAFGDQASQELGDALTYNNSVKELDLSYNAVTPKAAMVLANAFKNNKTLTSLNLDGNTLGKFGAASLMMAVVRYNQSRLLSISMNNCDLEYVDHNLFDPLQPTGKYRLEMDQPYSQMVAAELLRMANNRLGSDFKSIHHTYHNRRHRLNLRRARLRSEVGELPWMYHAQQLYAEYSKMSSEEMEIEKVITELVSLLGCMSLSINIKGAQRLLGFLNLDSNSESKSVSEDAVIGAIFRAVFQMVDTDKSGSIDEGELQDCLKFLGVAHEQQELNQKVSWIFAEYDCDNSHQIEEEEFVTWMQSAYASDPPKAKKVLIGSNGHAWQPPVEGILEIDFVAEKLQAGLTDASADEGVQALVANIRNAKTDIERGNLFNKAIVDTDIYLTCSQAKELSELSTEGILETLAKLLPQMAGPQECWRLIDQTIGSKSEKLLELRVLLGPAFGAIMGNATGHYELDLREDIDRLACKKMGEVGNYQRRYSRDRSGRGDTSQKNNWQNFRNELFNHQKARLSTEWFIKIPIAGRLGFDYVSTERPSKAIKGLSERRFKQLIGILELEELRQVVDLYEPTMNSFKLQNLMKSSIISALSGRPSRPSSRAGTPASRAVTPVSRGGGSRIPSTASQPLPSAIGIGSFWAASAPPTPAHSEPITPKGDHKPAALERMRTSIQLMIFKNRVNDDDDEDGFDITSSEIGRSARRDSTASTHSYADSIRTSTYKGVYSPPVAAHIFLSKQNNEEDLQKQVAIQLPDCISAVDAGRKWRSFHDSCHMNFEYLGPEKERYQAKKNALDEERDSESKASDSEKKKKADNPGDPELKCSVLFVYVYHKLLQLEINVGYIWITAEQAWKIAQYFPYHDFGRVQALMTLFSRIVDIWNCHVFLNQISVEEKMELLHRLGWLNLLNPMEPDGYVYLDLRSWEQREWCRILCKLAAEEPGENWINETYQWTKNEKPVPGWVLPQSWTDDEEAKNQLGLDNGPRKFGRLTVTYTSDPEKGCAPIVDLRKELKKRTLCGTALYY